MTNPLSDRGWSDPDYQAAVGTLAGEAAVKGSLRDYQAIADVIANRLDSKDFVSQYGKSITAQAKNATEFSTWSKSPQTIGAYRNAVAAFNAALSPTLQSKMPSALQERVSLAKQAVEDVFSTGKARGIAMGATFYDNPTVTQANKTNGFHQGLENKYGSAIIGDHRFTGKGFNPDFEFDPTTLHGQLQDVGLPAELSGLTPPAVSIGPVDLPGALSGFGNIDALNVSVPSAPDLMGQFDLNTYPGITDNLYGEYNTPSLPSTPDVMSTMDGPTYPGLSQSMYDGPPAVDIPAPSIPDVPSFDLAAYGPDVPTYGRGEDPYGQTPDFNAPSLAEKQAFQAVSDPVTSYSFDSVTHALNGSLMNELSPKQSFETVSAPEAYTKMETRTREVPFSAPNSYQDAVQAAIDDQHPRAPSKPQTKIETYQVPVQATRMVEKQVPAQPRALPSLPAPTEIPAAPALSSSFASAPAGLADQFGTGLHGFEGFMAGIGARDQAAMDAVNNAGMGYAANYAMGDGVYSTMGYNDLADRFGKDFGMNARTGLAEGLKKDWNEVSPTARGGIEGAMKGLAMGGPLGMMAGGALGALGGYVMPDGILGTLGSFFGGNSSDSFGGYTPDPHQFDGIMGQIDNFMSDYNGGNGGFGAKDDRSFGGDPSQDGGARYS